MNERYLYGTAIPILLDGGRLAGKTALYLYARYGLDVHWLGVGWRPLLAVYAKRLTSLPLTPENDRVTLRVLQALAEQYRRSVGIPTLIPCSPAAEGFLTRNRDALEEDYILLPTPDLSESPIRGLLRTE